MSILNDWGAFTNHTAAVHIHIGIKQWKAADCLNTQEEKSKNRFLPQWDKDLPEQFSGSAITPYQLLFMKQFLVNMVAMQKDFYLVARKSLYSEPNGPMRGNDLDQYYQDVSEKQRSHGGRPESSLERPHFHAASETLKQIRESQAALLEDDRLAQHFLFVLKRDAQWDPSLFERTPLKRINSLRTMADAGFSIQEQKP